MLKVVGASWQKTRIGTYILIGAGLLVIGAFFVADIDRPKYDGTYCATAFWTKQVGFQIEYWKQQKDLLNIPTGAARICYKDSIYENGWAQIEVETQRSYPDWVQAYGAGILEGSLTWNSIYNQWLNTIDSSCERDESSQNFCTWLRELLMANYANIKEAAAIRGEHDHYWHQISLYFNQLEGLETGYMRGAKRARSDLEEEIPFSDFLLMNSAADIQDLKIYYENFILSSPSPMSSASASPSSGNSTGNQTASSENVARNFFLPSATMLTKIFQTPDSPAWKLLFGHSTAGSYASMLRIQKRYKFHYHFTPNQRTNTVPGIDITFTGYPGILASTDDFYMIKGRQLHAIVGGVGIKNDNLHLWQAVDVSDSVPLTARVMSANRIAQNRRTWAKAMARHPCTGSKQWITIDLHKLSIHGSSRHPIADAAQLAVERQNHHRGLIWIVEQLPGRMHLKDVTDNFMSMENSTWIANGVPYFDEILEASGVSRDNFSFDLSPPEQAELTSLEAVDKYLRMHGFRGDLLHEDEVIPYGNIDIKLFSYNARIGQSDFHAIAGPIFMRLQHIHNTRAASEITSELDANNDDAANAANAANAASASAAMMPPSGVQDDRLTVTIDEAAELAELEMISERRSVRNDMRAITLRQIGSGPFRWSDIDNRMAEIEHEGHPDEFNFGKVAPNWAW